MPVQAVARKGDEVITGHGCDGTTTIATGSSNVFINNIPAARAEIDTLTAHTIPSGDDCVGHDGVIIAKGSLKTLVNNYPLARVKDQVDAGAISKGSLNVFSG